MSGLTADKEAQVINDIVLAGGSVFIALHTADPGNDPDGTTEVTATGYSRQEVTDADWALNGSGPTTLTNTAVIDFPTLEQDAGTITHATLNDGGTIGDADAVLVGTVDPQKLFEAGDFPRYDTNNITFDID